MVATGQPRIPRLAFFFNRLRSRSFISARLIGPDRRAKTVAQVIPVARVVFANLPQELPPFHRAGEVPKLQTCWEQLAVDRVYELVAIAQLKHSVGSSS